MIADEIYNYELMVDAKLGYIGIKKNDELVA